MMEPLGPGDGWMGMSHLDMSMRGEHVAHMSIMIQIRHVPDAIHRTRRIAELEPVDPPESSADAVRAERDAR